ncbi:hypothetical protein WJX74_009792 [Apatococcus lobatus]|uniref:CCHC-type domain-containing protein n=1 Tax=Apatococcus lobatus TaxID=904363 RepID=A0AAW1SCC3_9CHLO
MPQGRPNNDKQAGANAGASLTEPASGHAARRAAADKAALKSAVADAHAVVEAEREGSPDLSRPLHFLSEGARARLTQALSKGGFDSAVNSYEGLLTLARSQGAVGGQNRGACKNCGQLGHLTKQCRNHLSTHFNQPQPAASPGVTAAPALPSSNESSSLSDLSSSNDDSGLSSGSSSGEEQQRKRRHHKRKHSESAAKRWQCTAERLLFLLVMKLT